ncbi:N-acetyl sugar amidotransferase [Candidatus Omnitrophota bacterium]
MKYCKKCVQPDTRPKIKFDENRICYACKFAEERKSIDWGSREKELKEIVKKAKLSNKGQHDCIIGISGGKDSTFQALYAREKLGLNCLLVNLAPDGITKCGACNIENLIQHGFDTMIYRPNPKIWKRLIKHSFYKFGNPVKPTEYPLWAVSYITALNCNIPLIIQGENAGVTLGIPEGLGSGDDAANVNLGNTLNGGNASDWEIENIRLSDLIWYQFPKKEALAKSNIRAIYLDYYAKEWSFWGNTDFSIKKGLTKRMNHDPSSTGRTNPYGSIDSDMQIVNQILKYYKFGFGFTTDEAGYAIREGKMTRKEAIDLVKKYDGKCGDKYIEEFCEYIDISIDEFWRVVEKFVNRKLFTNGKSPIRWKPKFEVGIDFDEEQK